MKKHENPVLGAAPHRVDHVDPEFESQVAKAEEEEKREKGDKPVPVVYKADPWENWEDDTAIFNSQVAATVNGAPILNGEVLDRYSGVLITMREKMQKSRVPPEQFKLQRDQLVKQDLFQHIQRKLLLERMRTSLKSEQIKQIQTHFDGMFQDEIERLKKEMKVSTRTELELELNKKGTTLENVREAFINERMAGSYMFSKLEKPKHIERADIIAYYQAHPDEFTVPAHVEWEQIQVSFGTNRSKDEARQKIKQALAELREGTSFAEIAKKYSDGPTATKGGHWEPMEVGSLVDKSLEQLLFEIPVGQLRPYDGTAEFQIVRVITRTEPTKTQVGEVQEEIRKKIDDEQRSKLPRQFLEKLTADAVVETRFDARPGEARRGEERSPIEN